MIHYHQDNSIYAIEAHVFTTSKTSNEGKNVSSHPLRPIVYTLLQRVRIIFEKLFEPMHYRVP